MGIRIHKLLGYGLTDVKKNDPRFNVPQEEVSELVRDKYDELYKYLTAKIKTDKDIRVSCSDYYSTLMAFGNKAYKNKNCVHYDSEFGLSRVMLFQPVVGHEDWSRYDDPIDYQDTSSCKGQVKITRWRSIYPYDGFIDAQTGTRFQREFMHEAVCHINMHIEEGTPLYDSEFFKAMSDERYATFDEYKKNVYPAVAQSIVELCKFFKVFKDEKTVHTMVPMIYTYWS